SSGFWSQYDYGIVQDWVLLRVVLGDEFAKLHDPCRSVEANEPCILYSRLVTLCQLLKVLAYSTRDVTQRLAATQWVVGEQIIERIGSEKFVREPSHLTSPCDGGPWRLPLRLAVQPLSDRWPAWEFASDGRVGPSVE